MEIVEYNVADAIAFITLNRPEKRNAMSAELIAALKQAFQKADADDAVKIVVLKANGDAFCAGADLAYLKQLQAFSFEDNLADSRSLRDLFWQIYSFRKIVIAQVQGPAIAGGCGLATVCDLCIASEKATFGYTEVRIGFVPALVTVFLLRKANQSTAAQLLLTGSVVGVETMKQIGLICKTTTHELLEQEVVSFANNLIHTNSYEAMALTKKMMIALNEEQMKNDLDLAAQINAKARSTDDCKRGIAAFLNKEKLDWR